MPDNGTVSCRVRSVVTTMPVLLIFLVLQRYYLTGLLGGGVKG